MALRNEIEKIYEFEAAHRLLGMPEGHQCGRIHGHSYKVHILLSAPNLDDKGMVVDFGEVSKVVKPMIADLDHRLLLHREDPIIPSLEERREPFRALPLNPTAENLARLFWDVLLGLYPPNDDPAEEIRLDAVMVWETRTSRGGVRR